MVKHSVETFTTAATLEAAIEAIDTTKPIQVVPYLEAGRQVFKLIIGA